MSKDKKVSNAIFTPGPWTAAHYPEHDEPCYAISAEGHAPDLFVALCYYQAGMGDIPEHDDYEERRRATAEANARLIAAAPSLLQALKHLEQVCQEQCPSDLLYDNTDMVEALQLAEKEIAKVEGR